MRAIFSKLEKNNAVKTPKAALQWLRAFLNSYIFYAMEFLLALSFILGYAEVEGVLVFAALISLILVVCDDITPTTMPFLLVCALATNCYDSFDTFIKFAPFAPLIIACVLFHFIYYRKPYTVGESVKGIIAVSIALLVGGIGKYTLMDYAKGAYYVLGLGVGMIFAYLVMKSEFSSRARDYDIKERFSVIMLIWAAFSICIMVIGEYRLEKYGAAFLKIYHLPFSQNNIATFLMFAMPFPLYLSKKHWLWAIFTPVILWGLFYSGSRGGILFGCIEFCACVAYWIYLGKDNKNRKIRGCIVGGVALIGLIFCVVYWQGIVAKIDDIFHFSNFRSEIRYQMLLEGFENFRENPLVGTGILDDSIAYGAVNKKGTMTWYHMMTAQVMGSMGLVGVATYVFQFLGRVELIFTKKTAWSLCLGLSYLGILGMSQVNPGEFCPIPFELLTVLLFIFQEERFESKPLVLKDFLKRKNKETTGAGMR